MASITSRGMRGDFRRVTDSPVVGLFRLLSVEGSRSRTSPDKHSTTLLHFVRVVQSVAESAGKPSYPAPSFSSRYSSEVASITPTASFLPPHSSFVFTESYTTPLHYVAQHSGCMFQGWWNRNCPACGCATPPYYA